MSQKPEINKPVALSVPGFKTASADPIMGGVNIPQFSSVQSEVSPEAAPLWNFVLRHAKKITFGIVAGVVIALLIAGWQWYREQQLEEAKMKLGQIISQQDPGKRVSGLEAFLKDAPSSLKLSVTLELASSASEMEDWNKALSMYEKVAQEEGKSPLAFVARLNIAQIKVRKGDYAAAQSDLETLVSLSTKQLLPVLYEMIGGVSEAQGNKEKAIEAYEKLVTALPPTDNATGEFYKHRIAILKK